jgi:hypothetical protein
VALTTHPLLASRVGMGRAIHPPLAVSAWHVTGHTCTYNEGTRYSILPLTLIKIFPQYYAY